MHAVLLTFHTLIVLAIIVVVLLQRSDGGALGLGGGGGGFMTSRGAANVLTRTSSVLAALFFATSLALAITAGATEKDADIIQDLTGEKVQEVASWMPGPIVMGFSSTSFAWASRWRMASSRVSMYGFEMSV